MGLTPSIDGIKHVPLVFQVDSSPAATSSRSSGRAGRVRPPPAICAETRCPVSSRLYNGLRGNDLRVIETRPYFAPWDLGIGVQSQKNKNHGASGARKKFDDIFSHLDTIQQRDGQTDGHRATAKTALTHSVIIIRSLSAT